MKTTPRNLSKQKFRAVKLAGEVVKIRDWGCQFCGRKEGVLDVAHVVPRSRGFLWACDPDNMLVLCRECHETWHRDPNWANMMLPKYRQDIAEHVDSLRYRPPVPITCQMVDGILESLEKLRSEAEEWKRFQQRT